ncbi:MAG: DUF488 family protein [Phycisphaerales bacterium]|nr:DUF488 family protein [Phycisphaerales bacterium]
MPIALKRVYDPVSKDDGMRILVDRLWPRGLSKERAKIDQWLRDVAPSDALRKWFNHEPEKWARFKRRYFEELRGHDGIIQEIRQLASRETVTLVFAAKEKRMNNAVAFKEYVLRSRKGVRSKRTKLE